MSRYQVRRVSPEISVRRFVNQLVPEYVVIVGKYLADIAPESAKGVLDPVDVFVEGLVAIGSAEGDLIFSPADTAALLLSWHVVVA